jgi:hypothetical protein
LPPNRMRPRGRWPTGKSCKADENLRSWTCMNLTAGDDQATGRILAAAVTQVTLDRLSILRTSSELDWALCLQIQPRQPASGSDKRPLLDFESFRNSDTTT